ncbi:MAG: hypothetical protein HC767_01235 [Akkermansiaceae bacterium]|nr:hypothetical protein [Akkermansiaceae bacterium]
MIAAACAMHRSVTLRAELTFPTKILAVACVLLQVLLKLTSLLQTTL